MIRVLIVDDHQSMCESLSFVLEQTGLFKVVLTVPTAAMAEVICLQLQPDLVVMDICTEGGASGLSAAKTIRETYPDIKVVIMTAFDEMSYMPRAREAGAHGFILKSRSLDYFVETLKAVMNGEIIFPSAKAIPMPLGETPLTERELSVLRLMCKHMSNSEIAQELFITENTVKFHKRNMLAKTGFKKSIELAFYMISNGWINPLY